MNEGVRKDRNRDTGAYIHSSVVFYSWATYRGESEVAALVTHLAKEWQTLND